MYCYHAPAADCGNVGRGYLIEKRELNGRTVTEVTRLDTDAKVDEISRLIGGAEIELTAACTRVK